MTWILSVRSVDATSNRSRPEREPTTGSATNPRAGNVQGCLNRAGDVVATHPAATTVVEVGKVPTGHVAIGDAVHDMSQSQGDDRHPERLGEVSADLLLQPFGQVVQVIAVGRTAPMAATIGRHGRQVDGRLGPGGRMRMSATPRVSKPAISDPCFASSSKVRAATRPPAPVTSTRRRRCSGIYRRPDRDLVGRSVTSRSGHSETSELPTRVPAHLSRSF